MSHLINNHCALIRRQHLEILDTMIISFILPKPEPTLKPKSSEDALIKSLAYTSALPISYFEF